MLQRSIVPITHPNSLAKFLRYLWFPHGWNQLFSRVPQTAHDHPDTSRQSPHTLLRGWDTQLWFGLWSATEQGMWLNIIALIQPFRSTVSNCPTLPLHMHIASNSGREWGQKAVVILHLYLKWLMQKPETIAQCYKRRQEHAQPHAIALKVGHKFATGQHLQEHSHYATRRHQKQPPKIKCLKRQVCSQRNAEILEMDSKMRPC